MKLAFSLYVATPVGEGKEESDGRTAAAREAANAAAQGYVRWAVEGGDSEATAQAKLAEVKARADSSGLKNPKLIAYVDALQELASLGAAATDTPAWEVEGAKCTPYEKGALLFATEEGSPMEVVVDERALPVLVETCVAIYRMHVCVHASVSERCR